MIEVVYNFLSVFLGSKQMITVKSVSTEKWKELAVIFAILSMKQDDVNIPKFIESESWRKKKELIIIKIETLM